MNWNKLEQKDQLDQIQTASIETPVVIFKHSTRCSISSMALNRLERDWNEQEMTQVLPYFLDLINYRDVSNAIAQTFDVQHQSPQVLLIRNGKCVYHNSHMGISVQELKKKLTEFA